MLLRYFILIILMLFFGGLLGETQRQITIKKKYKLIERNKWWKIEEIVEEYITKNPYDDMAINIFKDLK